MNLFSPSSLLIDSKRIILWTGTARVRYRKRGSRRDTAASPLEICWGWTLAASTLLENASYMPETRIKWLSQKKIPAHERLIFALDTTDIHDAKRLVDELGDQVHFYKLGLELFVAGGYFELLEWLSQRGKKSFVDLKFFDVPQTVASAVRQLRGKNANFVTVHGNDEIIKAACDEKNGVKILAVTVL